MQTAGCSANTASSKSLYALVLARPASLPRDEMHLISDPPLHRGDRRERRSRAARQAQRGCGEQEMAAPVGREPACKLRQIPQFSQMNALLEQAMRVKR